MSKEVNVTASGGQAAGRDIINEAGRVQTGDVFIGGNLNGNVIHGNFGRIDVHGPTTVNVPAPVRIKTQVVVPTGPQHISDEQAKLLQRLVREVVELEKRQKQKPKGFQAVWVALNSHCRAPQYRLIRAELFETAEKYLRQWIGRLNSMASAPVADNDAWRKSRYAYIKINTKGDEGSTWLTTYLARTFGATMLTELDDAGLDRTYRATASRKRNLARMVAAR